VAGFEEVDLVVVGLEVEGFEELLLVSVWAVIDLVEHHLEELGLLE